MKRRTFFKRAAQASAAVVVAPAVVADVAKPVEPVHYYPPAPKDGFDAAFEVSKWFRHASAKGYYGTYDGQVNNDPDHWRMSSDLF